MQRYADEGSTSADEAAKFLKSPKMFIEKIYPDGTFKTDEDVEKDVIADNMYEYLQDVVGALLFEGELIAKGISDDLGYLFIDFESEAYGSSLMLYLNKAQYKQVEVVLDYIEDLDNPINVETSLDIISSIVSVAPNYLIPGGSIQIDIKYSNVSNYDDLLIPFILIKW